MKISPIIVFGMFLLSTIAHSEGMKVIEYERHEFHGDPEQRRAELSVFVYDIPYFGACGIFPPYQISNEIFQSGGSQGGMGPGATWEPFQLESVEYNELVQSIKTLNPETLGNKARYNRVKFEFDSSFDHISNWEKWLFSVCEKHRDSYHRRQPGA
jgi:hypothetical protein